MIGFGVAIPGIGPFADGGVVRMLIDLAEELGYQDVWFGDHVLVPGYARAFTAPEWIDPLASCLVGLGHTTTLRFGTDVLVAPYRNPVLVAKLAASADVLGNGRLTLGFGVGYLRGEFALVGAPPYDERGAVTDEYLELIRLLWSSPGRSVDFSGRYVSIEDGWFGPAPVQDPMPLWVGGNAPAALRRAARLGTGWHPLFPSPDGYAKARRTILELRAERSEPFAFSMSCATTRLLDDGDGPFQTSTWAEDADVPSDFGYAPPVPCAPNGRPLFVGTPEQVTEDLRRYAEAGVEHITLRFSYGAPDAPPDDMAAQMRWFAEAVLPSFTEAPAR